MIQPTWWMITIVAFVVLVLAAGYLLRRFPAAEEGMRLPRLVLAGSLIAAAGSAVGTITGVIRTLVESSVSLALPVEQYWPQLPSNIEITEGMAAEVTGGGFVSAQVLVSGLSTAARLWLAGGQLVQGATVTVIALALALLCHRLIRNDPFRSTVALATTVTAIAVGVGGVVWQACFTAGGLLASNEVLGVTSWQGTGLPDDVTSLAYYGWPTAAQGFEVNLWPVGAALVLGALAAVFRRGARLQREAEHLRRETEGLV